MFKKKKFFETLRRSKQELLLIVRWVRRGKIVLLVKEQKDFRRTDYLNKK